MPQPADTTTASPTTRPATDPGDIRSWTVHQRLHGVMTEVSYVLKEDKKVNNQYKFVSHDSVVEKIRPAIVKYRLLALPTNLRVDQDGNRTHVHIDFHFISVDHPDDRIVVPSFGYGIDPQDKGPGKGMSYAKKYALLQALLLVTGDDVERDLIDHKSGLEETADRVIAQIRNADSGADIDRILADNADDLARLKRLMPAKANTINAERKRRRQDLSAETAEPAPDARPAAGKAAA